ncbi:MAG: iron ABC transporter substrate-binding protein [Spirochaetaceae bacterium 4572_7]|nr:MAG: iron ABC transporter substrate-binding protein [Spirochaetaceae bacterium 4572_7]
MNDYFKLTDTLYVITEKYPETVAIFVANGFPQLENPGMRKAMGDAITFEMAMKSKKKNANIFKEILIEAIKQRKDLAEDGITVDDSTAMCDVAGVLPCPVKIPLLEGFQEFSKEYSKKHNSSINYRLKSASGGIGWLEDEVRIAKSENDIPDLFISAGFELFFDEELIGRFRDKDVFSDMSGLDNFNSCFDGLDLKDPRGNYSILAGVPAIFLVNKDELNGRKKPTTWDDILSPEFENSLSLPVEDLDLFNAVLLTLYKNKGADAIKALGRNLLSSMHPAQMVKSSKKSEDKPAITVLPWFFTKMVFPGTPLEVVWPTDGSILSPVFIAAKSKKEDELADIVHFFETETVGEILRDKGYFPSVNPDIDNKIPKENTFQFLGWDYIYNNDITKVIETCMELFNSTVGVL